MELLKNKFQNYQIKPKLTITNERQLIIKDFLDQLNAERGSYPPIKPSRLGVMFQHMTTSQLKTFYARCKDANHFSKFFWFSFKKPVDN